MKKRGSRKFLFLVFLLCGYCSLSFAQTVTIHMENVRLKKVLTEITKQTGLFPVYSNQVINANKMVSINVKNVDVRIVLPQIVGNPEVSFEIKDQKIYFFEKKAQPEASAITWTEISGKITDAGGEPMIGASVVVKGAATGTITDLNGRFSLQAPKDGTLSISYVGYQTKELKINGQTEWNVALAEDSKILEDLVVIGFGTQKRLNLTGAVSTISGKDLQSRPVQNVVQALQGASPGLRITQSEGLMDKQPDINIRGVGSISIWTSDSPLILIDGMEGDIHSINPQDIESISVLKDAAASSIYGSKAPFGVILITTKRGVKGENKFTYTNSFRWNDPILLPNTVNSLDFATYFNTASVNSGIGAQFNAEHLQRIEDYLYGRIPANQTIIPDKANSTIWADGYDYGNANTNWNKAIYRNWVLSQEHNLSMNGGGDNVQYYLSANYLNMNGLMQFNQDIYNRYSIDAKITSQLNKYVNLNYNSRFNRADYGRPSYLEGEYATGRQMWPTLPLYDPNGFLFSAPSPPLQLRDGGRTTTRTDNLYQQLQLIASPLAGLKIFGEFNFKLNYYHCHWERMDTYLHDVDGNPYVNKRNDHPSISEYQQLNNYYNPNLYAEYTKQFKEIHNFKLMMGVQYIRSEEMNLNAGRDGIIVPGLNVLNLTSGTDREGGIGKSWLEGSLNDWATAGYYGRLNYNYKERYLFEANLRYDGSSRFIRLDNYRWNWFPSFSLGWNMAKESFMESLTDNISVLKLRASYGSLGNQNTHTWYPTYLSMPVYTANSTWLLDDTKQNTSYNPDVISSYLTWEKVKTTNVGLDLSLLRNRLSFTGDYYVRYSLDILGQAPKMPSTYGIEEPPINNTDLKTNGWELDLKWQDRLKNGLGYSVRLNLSDAKTTITRYPNTNAIRNLDLDLKNEKRYTEQVLGEIWGFETIGIAKTDDEMNAHLAGLANGGQDALGTRWAAGDIMYRDLNGDGRVDVGAGTRDDHGDLKIIGNTSPRYLFGIDLSADWKGFDFRAFFQGVLKRDWVTKSYYFWGAGEWGKWWSTCYQEHLDYFRDDPDDRLGLNLDSYYPRPLFSDGKNQHFQTRYLLDASYIRLKNLQLGYTFPQQWIQGAKISNLRIYVSGENLWTGTKLTKIFDPETIGGGNRGFGNVYPLSKILSCGLNLSF